ncbi:MAG: hypothetical protein ABJF11_18540 [Reichenbachiella sp.]|uniref:hypothetical protein n=1 Tax=Reichenbachiella sp. TaxID=2184521 RepID=UPI0032657B33
MENQENRNQKLSAAISVGIHLALLLAFFLILAWTEPNPPIPEYGIELSMGSEVAPSDNLEQVNEVVEEQSEEAEAEVEEANEQSEQEAASEVKEPIQESTENEAQESITEDINSPDIVDETTEAQANQPEIIDEPDQGSDAQTVEAEKPTEEEQSEEKIVESPEIDERAIFKKSDSSTNSGGTGSSLELAGWDWDFRPEPDDKSSENGKIVFEITIDEEGEIIGIKTLEKTVSPVVEKVYRDAVMELTFSRKSDNRVAAARSIGKITFIIQSK